MKKYLVNFATPNYFQAQERQAASAIRLGVDRATPWRPCDLRQTPFFRANAAIFSQRRGFGYWLWKPFIVLDRLNAMQDGDALLYMDAGAELVAPIDPLVELACDGRGVVSFRMAGRKARYWTKRDCLVLMGADTPEFHDADQVNGAFLVLVKNRFTLEFVKTWLAHAQDPRVLTDAPSACGLPEHPDFVEHRHDQSILSLLVALHGLPAYRDPSQYGNHLKPEPLRLAGEYLDRPYADQPCENSPYGTLVNHHRQREPEPSLFRRSLRYWKKKLVVEPREEVRRRAILPPQADSDCASAVRFLTSQLERPVRFLGVGPRTEMTVAASDFFCRTIEDHFNEAAWERLSAALTCREPARAPLPGPTEGRCGGSAAAVKEPPPLSSAGLSGEGVERSEGQFNAICFPRCNWADELVWLWSFVEKFDLLDTRQFVLVWDDLYYNAKGLDNIWRRLNARLGEGACERHLIELRPRSGSNNAARRIAIIRTRPRTGSSPQR